MFSKLAELKSTFWAEEAVCMSEDPPPIIAILLSRLSPPTVLPPEANA